MLCNNKLLTHHHYQLTDVQHHPEARDVRTQPPRPLHV